ncbi:SH3 domain-containing protein [Methyloligella sp. 2.7D]|uniref:SH3 domain-containing protein n=1 Tax=unclassified Methyloligella TaxID=2625955 RepID=UPI00157D856A|nr:SH3 domain-containing protein [Methyloligella sp. GL2]QKP78010.1 SH3 domain-containing protein [Methyloligella sp. GL2]
MPSFRRSFIAACLTVASLFAVGVAALAEDLDVTIYESGGDGQMAECWLGIVKGLDPKGDGFLAVRSGPGGKYRKIDEVHNGDHVMVYDERGKWLGVIYGPGDSIIQKDVLGCGFIGKGKRPVPYPGKKGWIHSKWVDILAG